MGLWGVDPVQGMSPASDPQQEKAVWECDKFGLDPLKSI